MHENVAFYLTFGLSLIICFFLALNFGTPEGDFVVGGLEGEIGPTTVSIPPGSSVELDITQPNLREPESLTDNYDEPTPLAVPVSWNTEPQYTLRACAESMKDESTLYIDCHLNSAGGNYALAIASDSAENVANAVVSWWGDLISVPHKLWLKKDKFALIRIANQRGMSVIIWEPAFVDGPNPDQPKLVIRHWPDFIDKLAYYAKQHGYRKVKLYVGHENRDGGANWQGYSEAAFYSHIRSSTDPQTHQPISDVFHDELPPRQCRPAYSNSARARRFCPT
jgi:hypothetical protein